MRSDQLWFTVLGPVRAWRGETEIELGPAQRRAVLALSLLYAGQPVSLDALVDALWGEDPPSTAVNQVHGHIGKLRRLLEPGLAPRAVGRWLLRAPGGYRMDVDADSLDLLRYRRGSQQARQAATQGRYEEAVRLAVEALDLWQIPVASGLDPRVRAHPGFVALEREYLAGVRDTADLALRAGQPRHVLATLRQAAGQAPLDEPLHARLVLALAGAGQQAEALLTYRAVRTRLVEELGIEPGAELRAAHTAVLRQPDIGTATMVPPDALVPADGPSPTRPAQLPADLPTFTGRRAALDKLLAVATASERRFAASVVSAIDGTAGVGKTALAVHWAHRVADRYPDGQLYVNLRGFDPSNATMTSEEALRGFLSALGTPPERIPVGTDAQAALYRGLLVGQRLLILLDNARDTEQVRPLLPGSPGCLVIVTSRNQLTGLIISDGAEPLTLDLLPAAEARDFLIRRLGKERVLAEPEPVDFIIAACSGLPLALAIVAAQAHIEPGFPLAAIAAELREADGSLDRFVGTETTSDIRAIFSWSYPILRPATARLFRLLGMHPGPDIGAVAAASLAGVPAREARLLLDELVHAHLITRSRPGRYALHDLLGAYARELVNALDSEQERRIAMYRLLDHYLHTAHAAALRLTPGREPLALAPPAPGVILNSSSDGNQALTWFTAECPVLLAAVAQAAGAGLDDYAWKLVWTLDTFLFRQGHWHDWSEVRRTALAVAARSGDPGREAEAHRDLGHALSHAGSPADARRHLTRAIDIFAQLGDLTGQAHAQRGIGRAYLNEHRYRASLAALTLAGELYRKAGNLSGEAKTLNEAGYLRAKLGDPRLALDLCERALSLFRQLGDRHGQAATLDSLGFAQYVAGAYPQAIDWYRRAVHEYGQVGDRPGQATACNQLGDAYHAIGAVPQAAAAWRQALDLLTPLNHSDVTQISAKLDAVDPIHHAR